MMVGGGGEGISRTMELCVFIYAMNMGIRSTRSSLPCHISCACVRACVCSFIHSFIHDQFKYVSSPSEGASTVLGNYE